MYKKVKGAHTESSEVQIGTHMVQVLYLPAGATVQTPECIYYITVSEYINYITVSEYIRYITVSASCWLEHRSQHHSTYNASYVTNQSVEL